MDGKKRLLKAIELKVISALMKDSTMSDRELAKELGSSQPTVSRTRNKLEKEGIIEEYALIPDSGRLGFQIMGVTLIRLSERPTKEEEIEIMQKVAEIERETPYASLMAVNGHGMTETEC